MSASSCVVLSNLSLASPKESCNLATSPLVLLNSCVILFDISCLVSSILPLVSTSNLTSLSLVFLSSTLVFWLFLPIHI